ncbi:glycoside hydrolase family 35 protein [Melanogaster broomeanus]|nr:glycoside hydrolase family 35 protein [Melanogaster broomeanus]
MLLARLTALLSATMSLAYPRLGLPVDRKLSFVRQETDGLQNNVTWDEYSIMINGERAFIFSGEMHPYRMPVQSLYLDLFQKVKSMGFNTVSFYVFWGIVEPKRGEISFAGFRDLQPWFDAAKQAGIYLMARPGPYINAETTAGGFPGWGTYTPGAWRTSNTTYFEAWQDYVSTIGHILAQNQITNGGPVILVQSENEYTGWAPGYSEDFVYEAELLTAWRNAGIKVPITFNDASPSGHYLSVDIWGYDSYPNGFDCSHPYTWAPGAVPEWLWGAHMEYTPTEPNNVYEFQGGAFDGWGGSGYNSCAILTGPDFDRVFNKNQLAMSTTYLNLYMIYGGTNWGGIAHPGVYTSYDYGAAIAEDRTLREKYYELKLQANFLRVSPAYLTTRPTNLYNQGTYTGNIALLTTQVLDAVGNMTGFYVVRQNDSSSNAMELYTLTLPTSAGNLTIPQLGGQLTLDGKDSKIHVVDYIAGSTQLLYSTGEIMTWATIDSRDIIIVYGNDGELHETAFKFSATSKVPSAKVVSGTGTIKTGMIDSTNLVVQYTTAGQTVVETGQNAYEFWVMYPPSTGSFANYSTVNPILIKGGYLIRSVELSGSTLEIIGDLNDTASFEIIAPAASSKGVTFNGEPLKLETTSYGTLTSSKSASLPSVQLPHIESLTWKTANSLPEITSTYNDTLWTTADHATTVNPTQPNTSVVLYAGDYGYHTGNILWRAHFTSTGSETGFVLNVQGGSAFGYSVWLDESFLGSWVGDAVHSNYEGTFNFPGSGGLAKGIDHVITILQDHMGYEEDWTAASDQFKTPRGILSYSFVGGDGTEVTVWKVSGNLGGEDYVDTTRGPLNEGGLYGERMGWHLPGFPDESWEDGAPTIGISNAGVSFYRTTFTLDVPAGIDYPMALVVSNITTNPYFRSQFYVNGYQFGKYVNSIGPQVSFAVPQGILDYNGLNTLAVSLWAQGAEGARLNSLALEVTAMVETSMTPVVNQPMPAWTPRPGVT